MAPPEIRDDWDGLADPGSNHIFLPLDRPWSRQLEVWFHEVVHALLFRLEVDKEEEIAVRIGDGMAAFLRDNLEEFGAVLKWIKQEERNA